MASTMSAEQEETQRLIDECEAAGECIPCLELLKRIDADLAQLDREAAARRRRNITLALSALVVILAAAAGLYFYL